MIAAIESGVNAQTYLYPKCILNRRANVNHNEKAHCLVGNVSRGIKGCVKLGGGASAQLRRGTVQLHLSNGYDSGNQPVASMRVTP